MADALIEVALQQPVTVEAQLGELEYPMVAVDSADGILLLTDQAVVDGYTRQPPTETEEHAAIASLREAILDEPW
jgi:hypothetical protein